jgi:hypothetical protein
VIEDSNGAATARRIDFGDAHEIAGADANATRTIVGGERREQLNDLSIDIDRNEAAAICVEAGDGTRIVFDGAFERDGRSRLEAEEEAPDRPDEERLERGGANDGRTKLPGLAKWSSEQAAGTEADHECEQHPWREQRLHP